MLGGYIGQYLPISGGTLAGSLSLAGNPLAFDGLSNLTADGGGDISWNAISQTFSSTDSSSGGSAAGFVIAPVYTQTGNANAVDFTIQRTETSLGTGKQYFVNCIAGVASKFHIDHLGNVAGNSFSGGSFTAAQLLFVDGTNGASTGNGTETNPFKTIASAIAVATSGQCIFIKPGTYTGNFVLASGVSMVGSGRGVTILTSTAASGATLTPGNNSYVANMSIQVGANSNAIICFGKSSGGSLTSGVIVNNCDFNLSMATSAANVFCVNLTYANGWEFRGCEFVWVNGVACGTGLTNAVADFYNCTWLYSEASGAAGAPNAAFMIQGMAGGAVRINGGLIDLNLNSQTHYTDGIFNQGASAGGYIYVANVAFVMRNVTISGFETRLFLDTTGNVIVGEGCTFDAPDNPPNPNGYTNAGGYASLKTTVKLTPASSAVTPVGFNARGINTIATDAGTLTTNTLTINAPFHSWLDGSELVMRIKNTNASATAMTLAFNGVFTTTGFTVGTIAAGKTSYLTFRYFDGNGKFNLVSYVNGI